MFKRHKSDKFDENLLFIFLLTFVGGYMNAYTYLIRGETLVTMQSGNMARAGIALYLGDTNLLFISTIPILGCFCGVTLLQIAKDLMPNRQALYWQRYSITAEISVFLLAGFIPADTFNYSLTFLIALAAGFQICNMKFYRNYVHTTTLASGNVRNIGQMFADLIIKRDLENLIICCEYTVLFLTFTFGAWVGCVASGKFSARSIWFCAIIYLFLLAMIRREEKSLAAGEELADV